MGIRTAIGVDLGATNVVVSGVNPQGETEILRNAEGQTTTPAAVYLADERAIIGEEALLRGRRHPERLAAHIKMELGQAWYHSTIGGVHVPPDALQACILRQLRKEWDQRFPGEKIVTIAVPGMFNDVQRSATLEAARLAGITHCKIIDEPLAATLAYAEKVPQSFVGDSSNGKRILVLNMGGQASEVSLLWFNPAGLSTLATEGDAQLGGHDWDLCLARQVAEETRRLAGDKALRDPSLRFQILEFSQKAKLALASRPAAHLKLQVGQKLHPIEVTRERFVAASQELLARIEQLIQKALSSAQVGWQVVDSILLVGGASQLPAIREMLVQRTGKLPDAWISPWEAIARGAARHSLQKIHRAATPLQIASSCTHSIGIEWEDSVAKKPVRKTLIKRNTPLPTQVTREIMMRGIPRKQFALSVWQGDAEDPRHCAMIGRAILEDLPPDLAADWPIDLKVDVGTNGRITVDAAVRYTQQAVQLVMQRPDCVSRTHFNLWQPVVESLRGLQAYTAASRQEEFGSTKIPVVIKSTRPADAGSANQAEPALAAENPEENRILALLRRLMPFNFRSAHSAQGTDSADSKPEELEKPPRTEPPMLEVIDN